MRKIKSLPWIYVPTAYFAEGVPYVIVNTVSVVMYKTMGVPNSLIALFTSVLYIPWVIKMLWGPLVDSRSTKRSWIIAAQALMAVLFALASLAMRSQEFFILSLLAFALVAFASATHDIAVDGFYMLSLTKEKQAFYAGIRSTFYRLAMIFASGILVVLAGLSASRTGDFPGSWAAILILTGILFLALAIFHKFYLPFMAADIPAPIPQARGGRFVAAFRTYFDQPMAGRIIAFILLYRLGEGMLVKMSQPFLLDPADAGGMGLSAEAVGAVYGTAGTASLLAGGIVGGWLISRFGFRRCIWPMALALNLPDLGYVYLAWARPPLSGISAVVAIEQFGYGLGFSAFTVYLMYIARDPFKTSHYAISTGVMALGMMLPGMASGCLQEGLGYLNFFILVCLMTIPGMVAVYLIPKGNSD